MTDAPTDAVTLPPHVKMQPVESHHHSRAGYDEAAKHLYIDFATPGGAPKIYRYDNFQPNDWAEYLSAESQGKHFIANIKPHRQKFPYTKVSNEQ